MALNTDPIFNEARRYAALLRHQWLVLALAAAVALGAAAAYHYTTEPEYVAQTRLMVERKDRRLLKRSALGSESWHGMNYELQTLSSLDLARKAARRLNEADIQERRPSPSAWQRVQRRVLGRPVPVDSRPTQPMIAEALRARVEVRPVPDSSMVTLSVRSADPEFAAAAANALADVYLETARETEARSTQEAADLLSRELDNQRKTVDANDQSDSGKARSPDLALEELRRDEELVESKLAKLTGALLEARTERLAKETTVKQIAEMTRAERRTFPLITGSGRVAEVSDVLDDLQQQRLSYSETYGERHPTMVEIDRKIRHQESVVASEVDQAVSSLEQDYLNALAREREFERSLGPVKSELEDVRASKSSYWARGREVATDRDLFSTLLQQSKQARVENRMRLGTRRVITSATVPVRFSTPQVWRNYRIALLAGLLLGLAIVLAREQLGDTIETPEEIRDQLGLPYLGSMPLVASVNGRQFAPRALLDDRLSQVNEALRIVRTNLILSGNLGAGHRIVVTSVHPGEGKSTAVAGLAFALAENGARVLAVGADLRRPHLHISLGVPPAPGLSDVLNQRVPLAEAVRPTAQEGLWVLPCGRRVTTPAELLGSPAARSFLEESRGLYDWVLLDVPPVLAVADTGVLAPLADGVVLVIEARRTQQAAVRSALTQLRDVGSHVVGAILNKVDERRSRYLGSYHYSDAYRSDYLIKDTSEPTSRPGKKDRVRPQPS